MLDNLRIGCAVPEVAVANIEKNTRDICENLEKAAKAGCDVVVFPELALTGATCGDLFIQQVLLDAAKRGLHRILKCSAAFPVLTAVVGLPIKLDDLLYNCAAVIRGGEFLGITYQTGTRRPFADGGQVKDNRRIYPLPGGGTMAVVIGEETVSVTADLIVNPVASAQLTGAHSKRRKQAVEQSRNGQCIYAFCSAGYTESTRDLVYSGHSIVARDGQILAENNEFIDAGYLLVAEESGGVVPEKCLDTAMEIFRIQTAGLARRLQLLEAKAVVGVSGGLDSTLALLVAVAAMKRLGRDASDVWGVTMPGFGTTGRTYQNAMELMKLLGVTIKEIPIRDAVRQHFADIGHDPNIHDLTYENAQARERTQILMDYAGRIGGIVVGTGDLSELALGWCTYNGDHMSMYGVNASVFKTQIPQVITAAWELPEFAPAKAVLQDIVATPISPELLPPDENGNIAQQTEDLVGPYELHDFFLEQTLLAGTPPAQLYDMACRVFAGKFDGTTIKKWLKVFYRRFFTQQFKRSCIPEGVQVGQATLSPRGGWNMPSDASPALWLAEVDGLP